MTVEPLGVFHEFDSDYYGWMPGDVEWDTPPQNPPPIPDLPDGPPPTLPDFYGRETGADRFFSLSKAEQDAALGPETAAAVREGRLKLKDLVAQRSMETEPDFISQASPHELGLTKSEED